MKYYFIICCALVLQGAKAQNVDWEKFFSRNDMVFDTLTTKWPEGIYTGNGLLGDMIYMQNAGTMRIEIGRTDVADHRRDTTFSHLYTKARLPIGCFLLKPVGKILKNTARLNIWNAEATGVVTTDQGTITWRSFSLAKENIIVFQTRTAGAEKDFSWNWNAEESISPRMHFMPVKNFPPNPPNHKGRLRDISYSLQPMLAGGDYVTAWKTMAAQNEQTIYITVAYDTAGTSLQNAANIIETASRKQLGQMIDTHRRWWHRYYQKSFISLPDARAESFYWIQLYKMASATRSNTLPIDLIGPWPAPTPWPAYWYNLNIQLTYSPMYKANHLELVEPLIKNIDKNKQHLIDNAPPQYRYNAAAIARSGGLDMDSPLKVYKNFDSSATPSQLELGDLTWILYYYWQYYAYSKDETILSHLIPILKRSINYYIDVMHKEDDGKWHLPKTYSPEYPEGITSDCNYALSLFRWGCKTLLNMAPGDSLANVWKDVLQNLAPYPADTTGLRIGRDIGFTRSHRHYSHLLMIYPLHLVNWDNENEHDLIDRSLNHWHSLTGAFQGYSFTGGASVYALMGKGDSALNYLNQLFDRYIKPNTLYLESGPVIETPLAAAASLQELLLQSWNGKIRVFPAVPAAWRDVSFANMRSAGAFLISAIRKDGATKWIKIESFAGGKCTIVTDMQGNIETKSRQPVSLVRKGNRTYEMNLQKGQSVFIYSGKRDLNIPLTSVVQSGQQLNFWGTKIKKQLRQ